MLKQLPRARLAWLAALALIALFIVYWFTGRDEAAPEFQTAVAEKTNVVSRVSTSGSLQAVVTVDVGSQVSGRILELYADFNSKVKKGEKIAKIDPALFQTAVAQAEANVTASRANVLRLQVTADDAARQATRAAEVYAQRLISETERDNAEATARAASASVEQAKGQLAQALAQLDQARTNLRYTDIVSPTDGVVISRAVNVGQTVAASLQAPVIFTIAQDLRKMEVHTNVAESDIGRLQPGMRVSFTVDAYPGEPFRGAIRDIRNAPQVVQNVVTYDAVIDVANDELKLKPGMTATVSVVTDRRSDVLAIPNAALRFRPDGVGAGGSRPQPGQTPNAGGGAARERGNRGFDDTMREPVKRTVYVLVDGELVPREVTTGITDGRVTEITGGELREGESVIVSSGSQSQQRPQGQRGGGFRIL